jgi:stage III sporulation protein SpoIIIAA
MIPSRLFAFLAYSETCGARARDSYDYIRLHLLITCWRAYACMSVEYVGGICRWNMSVRGLQRREQHMADSTFPGRPGNMNSGQGSTGSMRQAGEVVVTDDLSQLMAALPPRVRIAIEERGVDQLLEVVLDLGRLPEARYPNAAFDLGSEPVTAEDIAYVVKRVGQFGGDNRAGIERTLHRISAIRNRRGEVVGLTCRVGRAVRGTLTLIRDVIEQGQSLLILGRPGVGKTTLLREAARVLADELGKRVVVVDTSNEIAGDGDIAHPGIGRARRMQVARPAEQHQVMIEAVENHMPEVIIIDEIGTELEAAAARTIAERGVQLVGTAHGRTLDNLVVNPTLADLVGGTQTVTLGDEEARRRGTQKTVVERKAPPTFDVLVEQEERNLVGVHRDVASAVDDILRGESPQREMRERLPDGSLRTWTEHAPRAARSDAVGLPLREAPTVRDDMANRHRSRGPLAGNNPRAPWWEDRYERGGRPREPQGSRAGTTGAGDIALDDDDAGWLDPELARSAAVFQDEAEYAAPTAAEPGLFRKRRIYPFGVSRVRLEQAIREMGLPAVISRSEQEADAILVLKNMYRKQPDRIDAAQQAGVPVFMLRSAGLDRIREALLDLFGPDLARARATVRPPEA